MKRMDAGFLTEDGTRLGGADSIPPPPPPLLERWRADLERIDGEITEIWHFREVFRTLADITRANPDLPPSAFFDFINRTYVATQAAAIRRQVDVGRHSLSMRRLLLALKKGRATITRDWFASMYLQPARYIGLRDFTNNFGDADSLPRQAIDADIRALVAAADAVQQFANQHIAHSALQPTATATYEDIDRATDELGRLLARYDLLLNAADRHPIAPIIGHDWTRVFTVPWITRSST